MLHFERHGLRLLWSGFEMAFKGTNHESINKICIKASRSVRENREQWQKQVIGIGNRNLLGKHSSSLWLTGSASCILALDSRVSAIRECRALRRSYREYQLSQSLRVCSGCSNCARKFSRLISFICRVLIDSYGKGNTSSS